MGVMAALLLFLLLQEARVEELLREFEERGLAEPAELDALLDALEELGAAALQPISEALARDLRDGLAAAAAPALVDALMGHPAALEPLRAAFRDPATTPAGRLEIARALDDLGDDSWREELRRMAVDPGLEPALRRKSAELLAFAEPVLDEPRAVVTPEPGPSKSPASPKKAGHRVEEPSILAGALFIGGSIVVLGILLWTLRRKD